MTSPNRAGDQPPLKRSRAVERPGRHDRSAVDRIGLGLAALGRPIYLTDGRSDALGAPADRTIDAMRARTFEVLDAAWRLGIRFFDLAPSYGRAEDFIGEWLAAHPTRRAQLTVSSKWGYEYVAGWDPNATVHERKDHSLAMLEKQWPQTQSALGGAPDLYLVHSVTPGSSALSDPALLDRLRSIADQGTRIGLTTSGPHQADTIDAALSLRASPFSAVQTTWNILERSAQRSLTVAAAGGWMVIVKEAMANGRLAAGGFPEMDSLANIAGTTSDALAIGAALAQDWVHIVLSGAVTVAQLESNASARPPSVDISALDALMIPANRYWSERADREWS
ncbi:aldo/keto reductase [Microbacterium istanbulense]|uniref:Aldo/keto reductase n=1 Tax=Microbacterium istanbulense TaxID=3122049 RepID=A0ABU8LQ31_9MICO